jgi:DNA-binding CsgD family transcriptional regulator
VNTLEQACQLTLRERRIVALVAHGRSTKQIARDMTLSPRLVERDLELCRQKLGASNRTQLVAMALAGGMLSSSE